MHGFTKISLAALVAAGVAAIASPSLAGCGMPTDQPASYTPGRDDARLIPAGLANGGGPAGDQAIVGLWSISLVAGGAQVDWGYSEWHSDGTEIMNSGGHTPSSGNFCLGVWRQSGPNTYHLKHYPLAYDANGLAAKIILTEDVSIQAGGASFSGPFTEDVYDPTGTTRLQHIAGTITGHRVLPN